MYYLYILRTNKNTLYIGQTNNIEKRLKQHRSHTSKSARYINYFQSVELVYHEKYETRQEAMKREWQLKTWSRVKKEALIAKDKLKTMTPQVSEALAKDSSSILTPKVSEARRAKDT